jgi:hypothetical protein
MSLFAKVFSTRTLVPIACVLGGVFFMKGLGAYYDFKWATALAAQLGNSPGWLSVIKIARGRGRNACLLSRRCS